MSYARMSGEYSDIYLIGTWHQNSQTKGLSSKDLPTVYQCMSCKLYPIKRVKVDKETKLFWIERAKEMLNWTPPEYYHFRPTINLYNLKAVYRHLRHHHYAHHKVPHQTWRRVLMEYWNISIDRMLELSADYASLRDC